MTQVEIIKAMIREMMDQEMKSYEQAVTEGEREESTSPAVYTMLQVLLAKIEKMPPVWHDVSEKAEHSRDVVLYDEEYKCMSAPVSVFTGDMPSFVECMNKALYRKFSKWAYLTDLLPEETNKER
jgi:hypothetical protein